MVEAGKGERARAARDLTLLALVGALLLGAFVAGSAVLYREFYSPSAFVLRYLSMLEHGRAADALALPGVALDSAQLESAGLPPTASDALLRRAALGNLRDARVVDEREDGDRVVVDVAFTAAGHEGEVTFRLERDGWIGIAPAWRFSQSPLAVVDLRVTGSMVFAVNGFTVDKRQVSVDGVDADPAASIPMLIFSPGIYAVTVDTAIAHTNGVAVLSDAPMRSVPVTVEAAPTEKFTDLVQQRVEEFLLECAGQEVLQPTGCPFGYVVNNRVDELPEWSIVQQPQVTLVADGAGWRIPETAAVAHIEVGVRAISDGSRREVSADVPFLVTGTIDVLGDGTASIHIGGMNAG
ncbi:hypothetical protein [Microbacterium sp. GXF7504]